jgi:hypothetical protein
MPNLSFMTSHHASPGSMSQVAKLTFFVLSARDPATDFRRDLVAALRRQGHDVTYARLARRVYVEGPAPGEEAWISPLALARRVVAESAHNPRTVVFCTVNLGFPVFSALLRLLCTRATWCFDLHDDMLYQSRGWQRIRNRMSLALHLAIASFSVCAAPKLREIYPNARVLPNASTQERVPRRGFDPSRLLVMSNVDERFDFRLVQETLDALPEVRVELRGGVLDDPDVKAGLRRLEKFPNFHRGGPYTLAEIREILSVFDMMLSPYDLGPASTYIDPLRFYNGLNNGIEILSTRIPRALDFPDVLHEVASGADVARVVHGLADGTIPFRNRGEGPGVTWDDRARQLVSYVAEHLSARA